MNIKFNPLREGNMAYFPKKYANQAIMFYCISLAVCTLLYMAHALPVYIIIMGLLSVVLFFYGACSLGRKWSQLNEKKFVKNVLLYAFLLRLVHVFIIVWLNNEHNAGSDYESSAEDVDYYVTFAKDFATNWVGYTNFWSQMRGWNIDISDLGYVTYILTIYKITGGVSYVYIPLILKAIYGSFTCVFMYRIAQRHFGENVGRMTAIFCMLQWNMIWWCGSMMKETEMIFLSCCFAERMDNTIMGLNIRPWYIAGTVAIGLLVFTFRSALFMTAFAATMLAMVMVKSKTLTMGRKVLVGIMITIAMGVAVGDNIMQEVQDITNTTKDTSYQKTNMEWRSRREHGNQFAKYATATVFAPLIFTIPFPNMVYTHQGQEMLMQVNGGNFEKNILSFFIIFAMFQLLLSGQWRQHVFPLAYYVGYLAALVLSVFAQSGRFHMPILPFAMMFGAYGLTLVTSRKHKHWFTYAMIAEVAICVFWSWFKLKGQGLI